MSAGFYANYLDTPFTNFTPTEIILGGKVYQYKRFRAQSGKIYSIHWGFVALSPGLKRKTVTANVQLAGVADGASISVSETFSVSAEFEVYTAQPDPYEWRCDIDADLAIVISATCTDFAVLYPWFTLNYRTYNFEEQ